MLRRSLIVGIASALVYASSGAPTPLSYSAASGAPEPTHLTADTSIPGDGSTAQAETIRSGSPATAAEPVCDEGTIQGVYAVHGTGQVRTGPFAVAGHVAFVEGRFSGRFTEVSDQRVDHVPGMGTYSLDPDCRGEGEFSAQHPGFVDHHTFDFYAAEGGRRFFFVLTGNSMEDPPIGDAEEALVVVLSGVGERLGDVSETETVCDAGTMQGLYALQGTGFHRAGPFAFAGHLAFDGEGRFSGQLTDVSDQRVDRFPASGTYSVDSDCSGEAEIREEHEGLGVDVHTFDLYGAANGQRFFWVMTGSSLEDPPIGDAEEALIIILSGLGERL